MHDHHEAQQIRHDQLYAAFRGLYVEAMEKKPTNYSFIHTDVHGRGHRPRLMEINFSKLKN